MCLGCETQYACPACIHLPQTEWAAICAGQEAGKGTAPEADAEDWAPAELQQQCARCFVALVALLRVQAHRPQVCAY